MRRVISLVVTTLGVFAIVLGLLLRGYAYPRLAVAPLDPQSTTVARGTGITLFDPATFKTRTNVTLTATRRIEGKINAPEVKINGRVAVWEMGLVTEDDKGTMVDTVDQWVCVDRRTGVAVQPCSEQKVNGDTAAPMAGLQYKFPFNTQQQDYPFYDAVLRQALPIHFDGEDVVDGLPVYRFVQNIPATKMPLPPEQSTGTMDRMYSDVRTVWVEPYTGSIVKGQEQQRQFLRGPDGKDGLLLMDGTLTFTPDTVTAQVALAERNRAAVRLLSSTGPWTLGILGTLLLVAGLVLLFWPRGPVRRSVHRPARGPWPEAGVA